MKAHLVIGFLLVFALFSYAASCNDIDIRANDISIGENSTDYFYFDVENNSDEDFDVYEVAAGDNSSKFDVSVSDYDDPIRDNDFGEIKIRTRAFSVTNDTTGEAYVKVRGRFDGGRSCSFSDIGTEYFDVTVEDEANSECGKIEVVASNVTMDEDDIVFGEFKINNDSSARFYVDGIDVSESSSYIDVAIDSYDSTVYGNDDGKLKLEIESSPVSGDKTATVTVKIRGHFSDGANCSYSQTKSDSFTVRVEDSSGDDFTGGSRCNDLVLGVSTITVEKGKSAEKNFTLENNSNERFYVDYVNVFDRSSEFRAESNGYDKVAYANSVALLGVKVEAYQDAEEGSEKAYVSIRGHFQGGSSCRLENDEKSFYVKVVEAEGTPIVQPQLPQYSSYCSGFIFTAPSTKTIQDSGTISLRIENNTPYRATLRFYGNGLDVEPSILSVPAGFKSDSYTISVFASKAASTLYYEIETFNCLTRESTKVLSAEPQPEQQQEETAGEPEGTTAETPLQAIAGTALAALGSGTATAGLMLIAVVLLLYTIVLLRKK